MKKDWVVLEFETIHGRKLSMRSDLILEVFEGADGNAGIVLDLLDKPTVWLKDSYAFVLNKWKDTE